MSLHLTNEWFSFILGFMIVGSFWDHPVSFWDHFGITLRSFWYHVEIVLGSLWDHFRIHFASCWDDFRIIVGWLCDHCGVCLGWFGSHFGIIIPHPLVKVLFFTCSLPPPPSLRPPSFLTLIPPNPPTLETRPPTLDRWTPCTPEPSGFKKISKKSKKNTFPRPSLKIRISRLRENARIPQGGGRSPPPGGSSAFFKQHSRNSNFEWWPWKGIFWIFWDFVKNWNHVFSGKKYPLPLLSVPW